MNYLFTLKHISWIILFSFNGIIVNAQQNYFANPSFEAVNNCTEYHADCAPEAWFNIPATNYAVNGRLIPKPAYGNSVLFLPVGSVLDNFNKPRSVYTGLSCPLLEGEKYILSFFICTKKINFTGLAVYFTEKEPNLKRIQSLNEAAIISITTVHFDSEYKEEWKHVKYEYTAMGREKFFIFSTKGLPKINYEMDKAMNKSGDVFYFIDEVLIKPVNTIPLCETANSTIDKLFAQNYRHSDGISVFTEELPKPVFSLKTDTILLPGLLFDVNKATVTKGITKILDSLLNKLDSITLKNINITGHTDNTGNTDKNIRLSFARANNIREYLIRKMPVIASKIYAEGKGQTIPKATNHTEEGKQINRRVEILLTRQQLMR